MSEIILSGTEETLKPIITLLVGIAQLLEDKDIGQFVGEPLDDHVAAMPHTSRLKLILTSVKTPPFTAPTGKKFVRCEYQIPDVNPKKVDWQTIKDVCGGSNGFMWGSFLTTVNLDNGRQLQAYGATAKEADNMAERMLSLTSAKPLSVGSTELKKVGRRAKGQSMYREPTRVYPHSFYIINSKRINKINERAINQEKVSKKRSSLRQDYLEKVTIKIPLWIDKAPLNFSQLIRNSLIFSDED